jgi:hypothetical protein
VGTKRLRETFKTALAYLIAFTCFGVIVTGMTVIGTVLTGR